MKDIKMHEKMLTWSIGILVIVLINFSMFFSMIYSKLNGVGTALSGR